MLNLAGVDLIVDNPENETEKFIRDYISMDSFMPWLRDSWPGFGMSALTYPNGFRPEPKFKLNRFHWPTGASRWAYGHFLASSSQVEKISESAYGDNGQYNLIPFKLGSVTAQSTGTSVGESISCMVNMLPPVPLSGIRQPSGGDYDSLYLITIVDQRYFWYWQTMGNIVISPATQWINLFTDIQNTLGINLTTDVIQSEYLQPSTMFQLPYEPIPRIFDAVCYNVGHRLVANYDGTFATQNYQTALDALNMDMQNSQNRYIIAGGQQFPSVF